ncbi:MAG TPA: ATP-binding protein [Thermoanaerobaculia bacterium]|nr:ATP-binding protein [Thermoanaerobaculia bacterium]
MRLSLRARLLGLVTLILLGAIVAIGVGTRRYTETEFRRFRMAEEELRNVEVVQQVTAHFRVSGEEGIGELANRLSRERKRGVLLVDDKGRTIAAAPESWRDATIERRPRGMVELRDVEGGNRLVLRTTGYPVRDATGSEVARLFVLPPLPSQRDPAAGRFLQSTSRGTMAIIGAVGLLALFAASRVARRISRPIEELREAAQRAARGDLGARVVVRTTDEVGQLGESFNVMASALQRDQYLRRQLASDVAHELRTPLTNIRCELEAVQDGLRSADPALVTSLHEEILRLARLVDDLQELSTAESGELRLERRAVRGVDLVSSAAANFDQRIRDHGLTLRLDLTSDATVEADPDRIVQVLRNLLSNAIEHSPVTQAITMTLSSDARRVRFEVADNGAGIAPEHLPHVFERFYRADASRSRTTGGGGLGLAIARSIVEAHGGTIGAESQVGRGSTFWFELPVAPLHSSYTTGT